jgi:hypothetical protein
MSLMVVFFFKGMKLKGVIEERLPIVHMVLDRGS